MHDYFIIYKPYNMLSQFTREQEGQRTLADLGDFPADVYPVGRLDQDSEGLLILTNDKTLTDRLLNPKYAHPRTYWVQVEGAPTDDAIVQLGKGVTISINGNTHKTLPAIVELLTDTPDLPDREPPIRVRKTIPTAWLSITLTEGKNRQVRRMTAAVGLPTLRLVRAKIVDISIKNMQIGEIKNIHKSLIMKELGFTKK